MEIWITRELTGILLTRYAPPDEIEAELMGLECYEEFSEKEEVRVEISAPWGQIKQLFQDIQSLSDLVRGMDYDRDSESDKLILRLQDCKIIKQ